MCNNENKLVLSLQVSFVSNQNLFFFSGNGAQFQIRVMTTAAQLGVAATGFDLIYSQSGTC